MSQEMVLLHTGPNKAHLDSIFKMYPETALISSYCLKGPVHIQSHWPRQLTFLELYAFMQADIDHFFPEAPQEERSTVLAVLSWAFNQNDSLVGKVANRIENAFPDQKLVAFSTFMPELMAHDCSPQWSKAQNAIQFLIKLARHLRERHPIAIIQLVSGNRTNGVWPAIMSDNSVGYVVNRMSHERAVDRIFKRVEPLAKLAAQHPIIRLAFDMEPGALSTLENCSRLQNFCRALENHHDPDIKQVVGVNLNIAAWDFLSGIRPEHIHLGDCRAIYNRILHCHVADTCDGYFSDQLVRTFHPKHRFQEWFALLSQRMRDNACAIPFSKFISCKFEAGKAPDMLQHFVARLHGLLPPGPHKGTQIKSHP